jgi:hypothetical protein
MCCSLQLPAARLLSGHIPSNDPDWERAHHLAHQISSSARRKPFCSACFTGSPRSRRPPRAANTGIGSPAV